MKDAQSPCVEPTPQKCGACLGLTGPFPRLRVAGSAGVTKVTLRPKNGSHFCQQLKWCKLGTVFSRQKGFNQAW
jgi:hypothetical protein